MQTQTCQISINAFNIGTIHQSDFHKSNEKDKWIKLNQLSVQLQN